LSFLQRSGEIKTEKYAKDNREYLGYSDHEKRATETIYKINIDLHYNFVSLIISLAGIDNEL
jgi:hypothetical protein